MNEKSRWETPTTKNQFHLSFLTFQSLWCILKIAHAYLNSTNSFKLLNTPFSCGMLIYKYACVMELYKLFRKRLKFYSKFYPCGTLSANTHAYCNSPKPSYLISRYTPKVNLYIFLHCLLWSCIRKRTEVNKEAI